MQIVDVISSLGMHFIFENWKFKTEKKKVIEKKKGKERGKGKPHRPGLIP
jgi:spore cortex formation protein SpoVR/YcgB (stage V sporulation)